MRFAEEQGAGCGVCYIKPWTNEGCLGTQKYDYGYLCKPSLLPWCTKGGVPPPYFFGKDAKLPLTLSLFLGLQHCLAMLAGIATSGGYLITNDTCLAWQKDSMMCGRMPWMISCAWLTSGILTIIQVFRAKIKVRLRSHTHAQQTPPHLRHLLDRPTPSPPITRVSSTTRCAPPATASHAPLPPSERTRASPSSLQGTPFYLGTGLISVMGTSFTFLPIARTMTLEAVVSAKATACAIDATSGLPVYTGFCHHNVRCKHNITP